MFDFSTFKRIAGLNKLGALALLAGLSIFWACHLDVADSQDKFDLKADSAWAKCDSLLVILEDTAGVDLDTLFNDKLVSLSQLSGLSAEKYQGGKAKVRIVGRKDGGVCIEQTRGFDDNGGPVLIDTLALAGSKPGSVETNPAVLELMVGDAGVEVLATIKPAFAEQVFEWSVDDATVVTLELSGGANGGKVFVIPQKNGTAKIRVRAKQDSSKSAELIVHVGSVAGKTLSLAPPTPWTFSWVGRTAP